MQINQKQTKDMPLNKINWRVEALEFAKQNDQNRDSSVAIIEKAMKRGAELGIAGAFEMVHAVSVDLKKKIIASQPHKSLTRTITIEKP